jgi:hypothetical protein
MPASKPAARVAEARADVLHRADYLERRARCRRTIGAACVLRALIIAFAGAMAVLPAHAEDYGIVLRGGVHPTQAEQGASRASGESRSPQVAREFQRQNPCPSTGSPTGACPGYIKDHVVPLACGGADAVSNMQWQTVEDAKAKDRWELKACGR